MFLHIPRLNRISFKAKLLLSFALFITIPLAISGILIYKQFLVYIRDNSSTMVEQRLTQEVANINDLLGTIEKVSFQLSSNTSMNSFLNEDYTPSSMDSYNTLTYKIMPLFDWFRNTNPNISKLNVLTLNESISEINFFVHASKYKDDTWFREIIKKTSLGIPYWEDYHIQRVYYRGPDNILPNPYPVYSLFCMANSVYKTSATYFELEINPKHLFSSINLTPLGKSGYMAVINTKGDIIYGKDDPVLDDLVHNNDFLSLLDSAKGSYYSTLHKKNYNIGFQKMNRLEAYIISIVPTTEIAELFNKSKNTFLYTTALTFILLLLLAWYLGYMLTKKIMKITSAFRKFQEGDFNTRIAVKGSDELDKLSMDFNTMAGNVHELINKVYKAELAQKQAELAALQAQIKPHFIYNTLESLKMKAELHDEIEISDSLTALGNLIRQNTRTGNHLIDIDVELENLSDYMKIQNLIRNNRIKVIFHIQEGIGSNKILNLVLQPIVENCILYGMRDNCDILKIIVFGKRIENNIWLTIYDNGTGIDTVKLGKLQELLRKKTDDIPGDHIGKGIGLMNVQKRIQLYFGNEYGIQIDSVLNVKTVITVRIPALT